MSISFNANADATGGSRTFLVASAQCSSLLLSYVSSLGKLLLRDFAHNRKPLGEPAPQVSNLALAIVILVVIIIQTAFVSSH